MDFILSEREGVKCWQLAHWLEQGVTHGFLGGDLDIREPEAQNTFSRLFLANEMPLQLLNQTHGVDVVSWGEHRIDSAELPEADAWISKNQFEQPPACLGIITADCFPVLCIEKTSGRRAAVHCGWRSAVGGILTSVLQGLIAGLEAPEVELAIGPGACAENYEVGEDVVNHFQAAVSLLPGLRLEEVLIPASEGKFQCDIKRLLLGQAATLGVRPEGVFVHPACTISDLQFFSFRRQKALSGRQLSYISSV